MTDRKSVMQVVMSPGFTVVGGVKLLAPDEIAQAMADIENQQSLAKLDPKLEGADAAKLADQLRPIGAKIAPHLSGEQATAWRMAMLLALSDLPPRIAIIAARKAIHTPMKFLNEVETAIREIAAGYLDRQAEAHWRLKRMRAEIERAAQPPQPQIAAPPEEPITLEEVIAMNAQYRRLGLQLRYISEEMYAQAVKHDEQEAQKTVDFASEENPCYPDGGAKARVI